VAAGALEVNLPYSDAGRPGADATALKAIVERYFSLFLAPIDVEGGDINETAGDGLMIIFQDGKPNAHAAAAVRAALAITEQTAWANHDPGRSLPSVLTAR